MLNELNELKELKELNELNELNEMRKYALKLWNDTKIYLRAFSNILFKIVEKYLLALAKYIASHFHIW